MLLKQFCKYTLIMGAIIIVGIKLGIRPYFHFPPPVGYFLGIAPNLLGSFLLPFGCYWLLGRYIDLHSDKQFRFFCLACLSLLLINESLQLIPVFGRTFDYNDIAASIVGLSTAYFFCSRFLFRKPATYP